MTTNCLWHDSILISVCKTSIESATVIIPCSKMSVCVCAAQHLLYIFRLFPFEKKTYQVWQEFQKCSIKKNSHMQIKDSKKIRNIKKD